MAELEPQSVSDDPIASLHRMSTTAGVATSDYVAINSMAIMSLVLGMATVLAIAWMPLMLVGLAGIVCGVMAIRQIGQSNGTQTGRGLAVLGILLSLLLAGTAVAMDYARDAVLKPDKQGINDAIAKFGQSLAKRDYAGAYALFDPEFQTGSDVRRGCTLAEFEAMFKPIQEEASETGPLIGARGNDMFIFTPYPDGTTVASTRAIFKFEKNPADPRVGFELRKQPDGSWRILAIPELLDQRPQKPRQ